MIYGPPGTGKTTTLKEYIDEDSIVLSHTRAASSVYSKKLRAGTLHSLAFDLCNASKDQIFTGKKKREEFARFVGMPLNNELMFYLHISHLDKCLLKNNWRSIYQNSTKKYGNLTKCKFVLESYEKYKKHFGLKDFNDLLLRCLDLNPIKIKRLIIDEAQDFSPLQWRLIEHWLPNIQDIIIAGDDDQSIFQWNGSSPLSMYGFQKKYKLDEKILEKTYRLKVKILAQSITLIDKIKTRKHKEIQSRATSEGLGEINWYSDIQNHSLDFKYSSTMIIYRNHVVRKKIEDRLIYYGFPYTILGNHEKSKYDQWKELFDIWKKFPNVSKRKKRTLLKYLKKEQMENFVQDIPLSNNFHEVFYLSNEDKLYLSQLNLQKPLIKLSTIHGAKGLEADHVVFISGRTPRTLEATWSHLDSEIRCVYVALSRARERLDIVHAKNGYDWLTPL